MLSPPLRLVFPEAEDDDEEPFIARRFIITNKRTAFNKTKTGTATATPTTTSSVLEGVASTEENNKKSETKNRQN